MSGAGADEMPMTLKTAAESYLRAKALSLATRNEYLATLRRWEKWGGNRSVSPAPPPMIPHGANCGSWPRLRASVANRCSSIP